MSDSLVLLLRDRAVARLPEDVQRRYRETESNDRFLTLALCGEVGELANLIKKQWRDNASGYFSEVKIEDIRDELADIRVYLELLARRYGIEGGKLDKQVAAKLEKVVARYRPEKDAEENKKIRSIGGLFAAMSGAGD